MERKLEERLKKISEEASRALGEKLKSIVVYGSVVSGDYVPRRSNVNMLVVLDKVDSDALKISYKLFQSHKKFTKTIPFIFDRDYIARSCDVFPMEFLDMKENYLVLYGEDPLKVLQIDRKNLRFQCEHELKGRLMRLRQAYLEAVFTRDLKAALLESLASFMAIFRSLIRLKGAKPPLKSEETIKEVSRLYNLDAGIAQILLRIKTGRERISHKGVVFLYRDWLSYLEQLTRALDDKSAAIRD